MTKCQAEPIPRSGVEFGQLHRCGPGFAHPAIQGVFHDQRTTHSVGRAVKRQHVVLGVDVVLAQPSPAEPAGTHCGQRAMPTVHAYAPPSDRSVDEPAAS